jgi:hypothetical protein
MANISPLKITSEISALVSGALDSGNVLLLAAVDRDRKPLLSFRGSTAVFSDTQLSFWARNAAGGTLDAIKQNPHVALMYRSQSVPLLQFVGRARIADDPVERDRAFDLAHERERASDPERKGRAVIVDLDEVKGVLGYNKDGPIFTHLVRGQP